MRFLDLLALLQDFPRRVSGVWGRGGGAVSDPMRAPLVPLGPNDALTLEDLTQGTHVAGATGSGKTSGSGAAIARAMLGAGLGGLVHCAKPGEFELWQKYARETGRQADLVRFAPHERWRFNPLEFELTRPTRGGGLTGNITALLLESMECAGRGKNTGGGDSYWKDALTELVTNAVHLEGLSGAMRLADLLAIVRSAPRSIEEVRAEESPWRRESFCFQRLLAAGPKLVTDADRLDYDETEAYWLSTFPDLASKTRSIIVSSFTALCSPMLRYPMRELFCTDTNITPLACERGAIVVLDLPVKDFGAVGTFAQVLWKMSFQKAMEQRDTEKSPVPVFLWADESQYFASPYDLKFLATARSSRVCTVYLTQNLPGLHDALGKDHEGKQKADALLGNLTTKIWHANGDHTTNEDASQTIGQTWQLKSGANQGYSSGGTQNAGTLNQDMVTNSNYSDNRGVSVQEQLAYQVLPQRFTQLRQGGPANDFEVDAIVFKPGRVWNATGTNFMQVIFRQQ